MCWFLLTHYTKFHYYYYKTAKSSCWFTHGCVHRFTNQGLLCCESRALKGYVFSAQNRSEYVTACFTYCYELYLSPNFCLLSSFSLIFSQFSSVKVMCNMIIESRLSPVIRWLVFHPDNMSYNLCAWLGIISTLSQSLNYIYLHQKGSISLTVITKKSNYSVDPKTATFKKLLFSLQNSPVIFNVWTWLDKNFSTSGTVLKKTTFHFSFIFLKLR